MSEADTIARLRRELMLAEAAARHEAANADHWRANHANLVARCALLRERPDLPVDRIPAYDELVRLQQERMEMTITGAVMARWLLALSQSEATPESWRMTSAELARAWQDAQPRACDELEGSLAPSQDRIAELEAALSRQPAGEGLTDVQAWRMYEAAVEAVGRADTSREYAIKLVRAIRSAPVAALPQGKQLTDEQIDQAAAILAGYTREQAREWVKEDKFDSYAEQVRAIFAAVPPSKVGEDDKP